MTRTLPLFLLLACGGDCPPPEVKGEAEPEVLEAARRAVARFFDRLPDDAQVCVSAVKFGRTGQHGGWYRRPDRRIKVSDEAPEWGAEVAVFHELCHAADLQLDLRSFDDPLWTMRSDYRWDTGLREGSRRRAREAFAYTCQIGPDTYDAFAALSCPRDDADAELAWLADVYGPPQDVPRLELVPVASVPTAAIEPIVVYQGGLLEVADAWFDLETGTPVQPPLTVPERADIDAYLPQPRIDAVFVPETMGRAQTWEGPTGARMTRVFGDDGVGCLPEDFVELRRDPGGHLLLFQYDGITLSWSRYEPVDPDVEP